MKKNIALFCLLSVFISSCGNSRTFQYPSFPNVQNINNTYSSQECECVCESENNTTNNSVNENKIEENTKNISESTQKTSQETSNNTTNDKSKMAKLVLNKMLEAFEKNDSFQADVYTYSKGDVDKGKKTGKFTESIRYTKMTFQKPYKLFMHVEKSNEWITNGAKLLYLGDDKIKVKATGFLGLFPVSFDINDSMFDSNRGHGFRESSPVDTMKRITKDNAQVELMGTTTLDNKKAYLIRVESPDKLDTEITHEIYGIDAKTFGMLLIEMYKGDELVSQYKMNNMVINPNIPSDFFKL